MNEITLFYNKTIYEMYCDLKTKKCYEHRNLDIVTNFPELYDDISISNITFLNFNRDEQCKCDACLENIDINFDFNLKPTCLKESRKYALMKNIMKSKTKNKYYNCKQRIKAIIDYIYNYASHNDNMHVIILVPNQIETIQKIRNIIADNSNGKIVKTNFNRLRCMTSVISLISPIQVTCGFDINPRDIGLVILNAFYYHMFTHNYEELMCLIWKCRLYCTNFTLINDSTEIFGKERDQLFKICDGLKILHI